MNNFQIQLIFRSLWWHYPKNKLCFNEWFKIIEKTARNIIQKIHKILKDEISIQIDTLLPIIKGEEFLIFLNI